MPDVPLASGKVRIFQLTHEMYDEFLMTDLLLL